MSKRFPVILSLLLCLSVCLVPAVGQPVLEPDGDVQREIGRVVDAIVAVSSGGGEEEVLKRVESLETAAGGSRQDLLLQIALFLAEAEGTEQSMGTALLIEHLDFSSPEVNAAVAPHLDTDDEALRSVLHDLLVERGDAGPIEQARFQIGEGELDQAEAILENALRDKNMEADALTLLTQIYVIREEYEPAIDYGKRAVRAAPNSSYAQLRYAQALRTKLQQISRARAIFSVGPYKKALRKAVELDPNNVEARSEEIGYLTHAPGIAGGSESKALERLDELEKLDWRRAMSQRAELYEKQKNLDGVIDVYRQVVERYPDESWSRQRLANALQAAGRYAEADELYAQLLESENARTSLAALYQLARSRILGEYEQEKAAEYLLRYLEKLAETPSEGLPQATHAYWRLGMAYEQLQRLEDARGAYRTALEYDAENKEARAALKKLPRG